MLASRASRRRWVVLTIGAFVFGCRGAPVDPLDAAPSPQAQAEPAPLANVPAMASTSPAANGGPDAGPTLESFRGDQRVAPDVPREVQRDVGIRDVTRDVDAAVPAPPPRAREPRELAGYAMQTVLRSGEGPSAPKGGEVNSSEIEAARRKTEARMAIEASQSRARFVLSGAFVLPAGTELRARSDRYGHLLLWSGETTYRVVEPGALRALLGERRLDVAPLSPASVLPVGEGSRRLGVRTRRVDVSTRAAKATLELAPLRDAGEGGALVCRMLLDLMSALPSTPACTTDEVPLHAELRWMTQGGLTFDVTSVAHRVDLAAQDLAAPPSTLTFVVRPPQTPPGEALLSKADLAAFRTAPVEVTLPAVGDAQPPKPDTGLLLVNSSDELRIAWIDGVPAAWVGPGGQLGLPSVLRGRYVIQWRTFLGDAWEPAATIVVPGASEVK